MTPWGWFAGRRRRRAAERRWRRHNQQARAAGCRCGRPATRVRRIRVAGEVPSEIWTCAEHVQVNGWIMEPGQPPQPGALFDDSILPWQVGPVEVLE
jgi:hypothetical protein